MLNQQLISKASFILMCILVLIQLVISNQLATSGLNLSQLENDIRRQTAENDQLKQEVIALTSIDNLARQAAVLGLDQPPTVLSLHTPSSLALNQ